MFIIRSSKLLYNFLVQHLRITQLLLSMSFFCLLIIVWYVACYKVANKFIDRYKHRIQALNKLKKKCLQAHFDHKVIIQKLESLPQSKNNLEESYSGLTGFMTCLADNNLNLISCVPEKNNNFKIIFTGLYYHILAFFNCLSSTCCDVVCQKYTIAFDTNHILVVTCWIRAII